MAKNIPFVIDALELYAQTQEGLPIWKTKGIQITSENLLANVFILSTDIAKCFDMRHNNLVNQNIRKLQKEKQLPERLLKFKQPYESGNTTRLAYTIYALTRHQTYHLLMDFVGPKARAKKHGIVSRLESIETDVLKGAFEQARQKASTWCLIAQRIWICQFTPQHSKQDIVLFLKIPPSTLDNFLRKYKGEIKPILLDRTAIEKAGSKALRLYGYSMEDVAKIVMGMDTAVGIEIKKSMFGDVARFVNLQPKKETQWLNAFCRAFDGLGLCHNYQLDQYRVDFFVQDLMLVLECNGYGHRYYDAEQEAI